MKTRNEKTNLELRNYQLDILLTLIRDELDFISNSNSYVREGLDRYTRKLIDIYRLIVNSLKDE